MVKKMRDLCTTVTHSEHLELSRSCMGQQRKKGNRDDELQFQCGVSPSILL